jgi:hypothetical protein
VVLGIVPLSGRWAGSERQEALMLENVGTSTGTRRSNLPEEELSPIEAALSR